MEVILVKVAVFVLIIALGYILKRAGVFRQSDLRVFSDITLYITLPCAVISNFRRMFSSVPMNTYIVMVVLSLLHVRLPGCVISFTDTVGAANPFMAMMMLGVGFDLHLDRSKVRAMGRILIHRYMIAALLAWIFYSFSPFPEEVRKVLAIISFAPLSAVCAIFTSRCHGDVSMSCTLNSLSIIITITSMTSLMILL